MGQGTLNSSTPIVAVPDDIEAATLVTHPPPSAAAAAAAPPLQASGHPEELILLLESGIGLERAHMGIFTELGVVYGRYKSEKLMEHLKLFSAKINIPRLIRCAEDMQWEDDIA